MLCGTMARFTGAPDYPHMPPLEQQLQAVAYSWGKPVAVKGFAPSHAQDAQYCKAFARYQRQTASPTAIRRLVMANDRIDGRAILSQIRRPTLVIHQRGVRIAVCANGRYLADHITGAVYLELPGIDHAIVDENADAIVNAIGQFAMADWVPETSAHSGRWLATVLFTDIVGSTDTAARIGDKAWSELLQQFHAMGRRQLQAHRGQEVDTAGDGLFATCEGPARAIRCAAAMAREARLLGLDLRAGLHTGEVLVSSTVKDLVAGSGIEFEGHGMHQLKGLPGEWQIHRALADVAT